MDTRARIEASSVPAALDVLGQRWTLALVEQLLAGPAGFGTLLAALGAPRSTLAARLRHLDRHGCVERRAEPGGAGRDVHALTARGQGLSPLVLLLRSWDVAHGVAPGSVAANHACGEALVARPRCAACGARVVASDVRYRDPDRPRPVTDPRGGRKRMPAGAITRAMDVLEDRWASLVLAAGLLGERRFNGIAEAVGVAPNILAKRLAHLEAHGLLARRRYQDHPPRDEYRLTPKAKDLYPAVLALMAWGDALDAAGPSLVLTHRCGAELALALGCDACGAEVTRGDTSFQRAQ